MLNEIDFCARASAIDDLEFRVLGGDEAAAAMLRRLEEIDTRLFERLRAEIRGGAALRALIERYVPVHGDRRHYDLLDEFINRLLVWRPLPAETLPPHPEMIRYQQTPMRFVLEMIDNGWLTRDDHFVDVGSGLGQVVMLANLLTGARATGIEIEPAFCDYAAQSAAELDLADVHFLNVDARDADFTDGTLFFLYTPFVGSVLDAVLDRLRGVRLVTYGPITERLCGESWLRVVERRDDFALLTSPAVSSSPAAPRSADPRESGPPPDRR